MDKELIQNEMIKVFLKIDLPENGDKSYYLVDKTNNTITLYDSIDKGPSDKNINFSLDKIFQENDKNSYVYEEICKNTIKNSINGISYSFIAYGDSNSHKINLLIGDINDENLNSKNIGIFPILLGNLIKKIKKEKINLKISYFLVYNSDLIDLSNLKNVDLNNLNEDKLYEGKSKIKTEENIIDSIKKENVNDIKKEINFLNKIFKLLNKIKEKEENNNILSKSHLCINIYIENELNEKKSIINFVILNGSEYLYSGKIEQFKSVANDNNKRNNKNIIEGAKTSLETQYTYETLFNLIKLKIYIDNNLSSSNAKQIELVLNKNKQNSKLTTLLYNLFFNSKRMNFRIIGSVVPYIGLYQSFKDTLMFLFDFLKIRKSYEKQLSSIQNNKLYIKLKDNIINNKNNDEQNNNPHKQYEEALKDNLIFELENKVNSYKKTINDQKINLKKKDEKIEILTQIYQAQINAVKKRFNFTGDMNILIAGDENSKEAEFIKNLKEASENNIRNEGNLRILQKKLEEKEEELNKLKIREGIVDSHDDMIKYYISVQQLNEEKNKKEKNDNELRNIIEEYKKKLKQKDIIIDKYKEEIENKNKILFNLPKVFKESYVSSLSDENKNKTSRESNKGENNLEEENKSERNESMETDNLYTNEIKRIKKENEKSLIIIKLNYENLLKEKNEAIKKLEHDYEILKQDKIKDINKYGNEIIKLNKILMELISNYKRIFNSILTKKCSIINYNLKKEEFDKIIMSVDQDINCNNFPLLYQFLLKNKKLKMNQPLLYTNVKKIYEPIKKPEKKEKKEERKEKKEKIKNEIILENDLKSEIPISSEKINQFFKEETNNGKIIFTKEYLEEMSKESIILHCININNKLNNIENYLQKYIQYKKGFNVEEYELGEKYKDGIIEELKNKVNKLSIKLNELIIVNNRNICVINSQNRKIDELEKGKIIYNNLLKHKKNIFTLLSSNKSTIYSSSKIDFKSINSSKSNKILKKSSSCANINYGKPPLSPKAGKFGGNISINSISRPNSPRIEDFSLKKFKNASYLE